jgi:myo-inositol 2-dehydrogenase/D-chiro-inositol 1-dehydrogenase
MSLVRCGLIGYGAWGQHHARAITETSGAALTAIAAHSEESVARARADHPQAHVYADYREMLAKEDLDLCDVVLPSHLHVQVAKDVLSSDRHLLLEKPMALDLAGCRELIDLAKARKRILAIGHELRMSSLWGKVKELIDSGAIGDPLYCLIELWRRPYRLGSGGWRYDPARVGDWILEEPIHFFDLARWYLKDSAGEPTSVYAAGSGKRPDQPGLHDNFSAIVHFPRGRYAAISQTLAAWEHHQTAKLTGTDGAIWASWSGAMDRTFQPTFSLKLQRGGSGQVEEVEIARPSGEVYELVDQVGAVVRAVRESDSKHIPCTGEDGWWSTAMCLKAAQSLHTGAPVKFDPEAR